MSQSATEERGAGLAEYALILFLVAVAAIAALGTLSTSVNDALTDVADALDGATPP